MPEDPWFEDLVCVGFESSSPQSPPVLRFVVIPASKLAVIPYLLVLGSLVRLLCNYEPIVLNEGSFLLS